MPAMQIDVLAPSDLTVQDRAAWRAFQAADPELASPFLSPDWVDILNCAGGPDARRLKVLRLRLAGRSSCPTPRPSRPTTSTALV